MTEKYQQNKDWLPETDEISPAAHKAMVALTELFSNLPKSYSNHRTYELALEDGYPIFRRQKLCLMFDDIMLKEFGPDADTDGDDIVPEKLAKQFPRSFGMLPR